MAKVVALLWQRGFVRICLLTAIYEKLTIQGPQKEDGGAGDRAINLWALWTLINLEVPEKELSLLRREVLERFLNRAWFRRAWVYQEAVVAKEVDVLMGRLTLPFEFVAELISWVYPFHRRHPALVR